MKNSKISTVLLLIIALSLASCANKKKQNNDLEVKKDEIAKIVSDYVYPLPSSFELMEMLNEIDAAYIIGISNLSTEVSKYESKDKQALNLGVYLSDLSYASIYRRKQTAQDYLAASETLIRSLYVDDSFDQGFIAKVSDNIDNKDTLVSLLTSATQNIYSDLHRKGHKNLAYLMVAGAWTEAMYITLEVSNNTPLNAQIVNTIIFQHQSLIETVKLLKEVNEDGQLNVLITALEGILNTFNQEDPSALSLAQFKKLYAQTSALRAHLIK
ncbi:MAG: hypothetical protein PF444_06820 [Bacteroidales bacterium]|jgi:hypothetical protein|nr:hypothetical protein [Bacteroidales bacterium]